MFFIQLEFENFFFNLQMYQMDKVTQRISWITIIFVKLRMQLNWHF